MRRKRIVCILLTLALAAFATGCGGDTKNNADVKSSADVQEKNVYKPDKVRTTEGEMGGDINKLKVDLNPEVELRDPNVNETPEEIRFLFTDSDSICLVYPGMIGGNETAFFVLNKDGTFEFHFEDRAQAENDDGYFEKWYGECTGKLGEVEQISELRYSMKITEMGIEELKEPVYIEDREYINDNTGLGLGQVLEVFLPGYPVSDLPAEFKSSSDFLEFSGNVLPGYAIYLPGRRNGQAFLEQSEIPDLPITKEASGQ